jgi:hypothetical protein
MIDTSLFKLDFPSDCNVIQHDFYEYDPSVTFNLEQSIELLKEDLLQCSFPKDDLIIDLGWYGDVKSNKGQFKILVIKNENWEIPANTIHSNSSAEAKEILSKILLFYTSDAVEEEIHND